VKGKILQWRDLRKERIPVPVPRRLVNFP
jgi:hypothetical protein